MLGEVFLPLGFIRDGFPPKSSASHSIKQRKWPLAATRPASQNGAVETTVEEQARREEKPADEAERGLRFEDPYWDDAFCAWWDPTLRTCC